MNTKPFSIIDHDARRTHEEKEAEFNTIFKTMEYLIKRWEDMPSVQTARLDLLTINTTLHLEYEQWQEQQAKTDKLSQENPAPTKTLDKIEERSARISKELSMEIAKHMIKPAPPPPSHFEREQNIFVAMLSALALILVMLIVTMAIDIFAH